MAISPYKVKIIPINEGALIKRGCCFIKSITLYTIYPLMASIPGKTFPSKYSSMAPPPVET